jgi:cyanuric acid amidohydrolase
MPSGDGTGRLSLGTAVSRPILPEEIGRVAMVESVAEAVHAAAASAGVSERDARYVMAKNPMLTEALVEDAHRRGRTTIDPAGLGALFRTSGGTALGVAVGLGDVPLPTEQQIGADHGLWSGRASASSGVESDRAQLVLFGNRAATPGRLRVGRATMTDSLDVAALHRALRDAGLDVPDFADPARFADRVATIYVKCNSTADGRLRGFPQVQGDGYADRAYTSELKASVGGMFAGALGDPAFYISAAGIHQGPPGGGSVLVVVDAGAA